MIYTINTAGLREIERIEPLIIPAFVVGIVSLLIAMVLYAILELRKNGKLQMIKK